MPNYYIYLKCNGDLKSDYLCFQSPSYLLFMYYLTVLLIVSSPLIMSRLIFVKMSNNIYLFIFILINISKDYIV